MIQHQRNSAALDRFLNRFEEAWQQGLVDLKAFVDAICSDELAAEGIERKTLVQELVCIDLEYRWKGLRGGRESSAGPKVEDYLAAWPELRELSPLLLIQEEYRVRSAVGELVAVEEYVRRFPEHAQELENGLPQIDEQVRQERKAGWAAQTTSQYHASPSDAADASTLGSASLPDKLPEFPGYEVLEILGRGGMGTVVKARHKILRRLVAIKFPLPHALHDGGERFLREARAAASLRHQHLCAIHEVRRTADTPYIVLAYIEGQSLDAWAKTAKPSAREVATLLAKLARAVHVAHENGIIHRDIKPGNIMVEAASGEPVLMDFGLAKELESGDAFLTRSGQVLGTPAFMSPEQAMGRIDLIDPLTDVYALGAVLYALLCGCTPFTGTAGEVIHQLQSADPQPPRKLAPHVHRDLETICLKAMRKEREARYPSALALAEDLERFAAGEAILARPQGLLELAIRRCRRQPVVAGLVMASVVAIGAMLLFVAVSGRVQREVAAQREEFRKALNALQTAPVEAVDDSLDSLTRLADTIAARSGTSAKMLQAEITAGLETMIERRLNAERLAEADAKHLATLIERLKLRDATLGERFAGQLRSKQAGWSVVAGFDRDLQRLAAQFTASSGIAAKKGLLVREASESPGHFHPVATTGVSVPANVRLEGTFSNVKPDVDFGFVLGCGHGHSGDVLALDFSPDGKLLASGGADARLNIFHVERQTLERSRAYPSAAVTQVAFASEENVIAVRSGDRLYLYDWQNDKLLAEYQALDSFAISTDRSLLATCETEQVRVIDTATGETLGFVPHRGDAPWRYLALGRDRRLLISARERGDALVWDWKAGAVLHTLALSEEAQVSCMAYTEGEVALGDRTGRIWLFDATTGEARGVWKTPPDIREIALSPHARFLAALFDGVGGRVWDRQDQKANFELEPYDRGLTLLQFDSSGKSLLAASNSRVAEWDPSTGKRLQEFSGQLRRVRAIASHANTSLIACGGGDHLVQLYHTHQGSLAALGADRCSVRGRIDTSSGLPEVVLQLHLDGTLIATERVQLSDDELQGPLHLRVQRVHGLIKAWLNPVSDDVPPNLVFHEVFPRPMNGVLGVIWSPYTEISNLLAYQRQAADASERLEFAENFFAAGRYDAAADLFHAVAASTEASQRTEADSLWQEAIYKEAIARQAAGDREGAEPLYEQLRNAPGQRWPVYAIVQLWTIRLREGRTEEAEALLAAARKNNISFAQIAALIPTGIRIQLIAAGQRQLTNISSYYSYSPHRVQQARRLLELEQLVYGRARASTHLQLIRACRLEGDKLAAIRQARDWIRESDVVSADAIDELAWLLREERQYDAASKLLQRYLPDEGDTSGEYAALWIDQAYVEIAQGNALLAQQCVDKFLARRNAVPGFHRHHPKSALLSGFLLHDAGNTEEARQVWAVGLKALTTPRGAQRRTGGDWLFCWLLSSLSGEGNDEDLEAVFQTLLKELSPDSSITPMLAMLTATPSGQQRIAARMKSAWQSERGRDLARRIAYQQLSFRELMRDPAVLLVVEIAAPLIRSDGLTAEEDALLWDLGRHFHDAVVVKGAVTMDQLTVLAAAQLTPVLLTGALGQFKDLPELASPIAYFSGLRQLQQERAGAAKKCFEFAVAHAQDNSGIRRLAESELERLGDAPDARP